MGKPDIEQILDLLISEYGNRDWQPGDSPLNVLVQTILSQNTSDTNSRRAFESLLASFPRWEDVASAEVHEIANAIKGGGLGEIKARYIKQALGEIQRKRGRLELDFLNELPLDEARDWLTQLPGVGTKTANCVFLFSLGRPALPVDTHIYRVAMRLGLIDAKTTVEKAHKLLESIVPPDKVYSFHVLTIEHGRKICKAQRPRCDDCVLSGLCQYFGQSRPLKRISLTRKRRCNKLFFG
jgi:endonuclease-3